MTDADDPARPRRSWPRHRCSPLSPTPPARPPARRAGRQDLAAALRRRVHRPSRRRSRSCAPEGVLRPGREVRPARPRRSRVCRSATSGAPAPPPRPTAAYVVVNAWQSDPAVMTDRVLLETQPVRRPRGRGHRRLRGRGERGRRGRPRRGRRGHRGPSRRPSRAAEAAGYLGEGILGSGVDIHVVGRDRSRAPTCSARRPSC